MARAGTYGESVASIMRRDVVTVEPDESLLEADQIMRLARIRHLPVARRGMLIGVLSHRDILEASIARLEKTSARERTEHLRQTRVEQLLRGRTQSVEADCPLSEAALTMLRLRIGCLPVVEPGSDGARLIGLVTESDLLRVAYVPDFAGPSD